MAEAPIAERWATSRQAPLWVSVSLFAVSMADPVTGMAVMRAGQLREAVAPDASQSALSNAIARAVRAGWLAPGSTAWCLRVRRVGGGHRGA